MAYANLVANVINKQQTDTERELVSKQGMSVSEYSRYEHHQAVKEATP